jgi:hypothetical protein
MQSPTMWATLKLDQCNLECDAVQSGRKLEIFRKNQFSLSFIFLPCKMDAAGLSQMLVTIHQTVWRHTPEDSIILVHRYVNLRSRF